MEPLNDERKWLLINCSQLMWRLRRLSRRVLPVTSVTHPLRREVVNAAAEPEHVYLAGAGPGIQSAYASCSGAFLRLRMSSSRIGSENPVALAHAGAEITPSAKPDKPRLRRLTIHVSDAVGGACGERSGAAVESGRSPDLRRAGERSPRPCS